MAQFPDNRLWGVVSGSAEYFPAYGPYQNEIVGFNPSAYIPERDTTLITEYISDPLREKEADLSKKGQAKVQEQKKGLGKFGQFSVDLGSAATQMVLDVGLGVVTGGSMAIPAAIRTFGSSATEAAAEGADLNQQMLYATTSAALSYGIEQFCNVAYAGLKGIAPSIADDFVTNVLEKLALKAVGDPVGAQSLTNIGMLIASGAGEGVEETLESLLNPFLQQLSYDKNAQTVFQNPRLLADTAYEGLIGGILGMFGSGTNTAIDLVANMIYDGTMPGEKLMEAAGVSEAEVLGAMAMNEMAKMENATDGHQTGISESTAVGINTESVTYRRVQGGTGDQSSQYRVLIDDEGAVYINNKSSNLNLSIDNGEHAQYYVENRRQGADIYEFDVPKWFDDIVQEFAVPQAGYKLNPNNQGGAAPKLTDPGTPGRCIEFPAPWIEWIEEYSSNGRIVHGGR